MTATLLCCLLAVLADDPVFSGPQPGEKVTPFRVRHVYGPESGKENDVAADKGSHLIVFVHEITRPSMQLLRPLDRYAAQMAKSGLQTHFIWLADDRTQAEAFLTRARGSLQFKSPVAISLDGMEGPGSYGLNRKVTLTILATKDGKTTANFAIVQPNETDAPKVLGAVAKLLDREPPTAEEMRVLTDRTGIVTDQRPPSMMSPEMLREMQSLKAEVARLETALKDVQARLERLQAQQTPRRGPATDRRPTDRPAASLPGRTPEDQEIIGLMRRLIQPTNDAAKVQEIVADMKKWAGDDKTRQSDLAAFCKRIAHLGYGSEAAKKVIKEMAGE